MDGCVTTTYRLNTGALAVVVSLYRGGALVRRLSATARSHADRDAQAAALLREVARA